MPDPFVLVVLLTLVALALGLLTMGDVPGVPDGRGGALLEKASALVKAWTGGFGNAEILKFGLQIILIVVTGEAIAASPPARRLLARLTALPRTATQALLLVTVFALITGWIHWGFGMLGNMYQPFWSLPLLGLMGLRARDIMGFCLILFVVCLPVLGLALLL